MEYINKCKNINKNDEKVWIALAPDYANLGDIAISIAQYAILKKAYPNRKIIEFPMLNFFKYKNKIQSLMNDKDIITIIGGGNMGNLYIEGEERRRDIISSFPNNKIISFPQSIDFENNDIGQREFQNSIDIYSKHKNLTIFSREEKSHNIMKTNFKNEIKLVPDTVIYLAGKLNIDNSIPRENILLCFRNDKEKVTSSKILCDFINLLKEHNLGNVEITDTSLGNMKFEAYQKSKMFEKTLKKFANSKLVITDRLHGMIFSLITKTPCIAFDNSNKKISSTYTTWLQDVPYIKLLEDFKEITILNKIKEFSETDTTSVQLNFDNKFEDLFLELKNIK